MVVLPEGISMAEFFHPELPLQARCEGSAGCTTIVSPRYMRVGSPRCTSHPGPRWTKQDEQRRDERLQQLLGVGA